MVIHKRDTYKDCLVRSKSQCISSALAASDKRSDLMLRVSCLRLPGTLRVLHFEKPRFRMVICSFMLANSSLQCSENFMSSQHPSQAVLALS